MSTLNFHFHKRLIFVVDSSMFVVPIVVFVTSEATNDNLWGFGMAGIGVLLILFMVIDQSVWRFHSNEEVNLNLDHERYNLHLEQGVDVGMNERPDEQYPFEPPPLTPPPQPQQQQQQQQENTTYMANMRVSYA